jgi:hypothetical protein
MHIFDDGVVLLQASLFFQVLQVFLYFLGLRFNKHGPQETNERLLKELLAHLNVVFLENFPEKRLDGRKSLGERGVPSLLVIGLGGHGGEQQKDHLVQVAF